ncbi:MAG TPA: chromate resistance protein ChrB domain-containing protein [Nitrososphaerales archaeon]|nr:chromate resistance protein ChrB domain-containing protein [Nitrososphaerales archaeon]
MKWVTRKKAKVDRVACAWLIRKFIDKNSEFIFVPEERVLETAQKEGAVPFDVKGAELTHYLKDGIEHVTFDALIQKYNLKDRSLLELAKIVRGADARVTGITNSTPESLGLEAAATGFRLLAVDDYENLNLQFPLYDALYRYCRLKVEEGQSLENSIQ